jgi:hypothetical protein
MSSIVRHQSFLASAEALVTSLVKLSATDDYFKGIRTSPAETGVEDSSVGEELERPWSVSFFNKTCALELFNCTDFNIGMMETIKNVCRNSKLCGIASQKVLRSIPKHDLAVAARSVRLTSSLD